MITVYENLTCLKRYELSSSSSTINGQLTIGYLEGECLTLTLKPRDRTTDKRDEFLMRMIDKSSLSIQIQMMLLPGEKNFVHECLSFDIRVKSRILWLRLDRVRMAWIWSAFLSSHALDFSIQVRVVKSLNKCDFDMAHLNTTLDIKILSHMGESKVFFAYIKTWFRQLFKFDRVTNGSLEWDSS